MYLKSIILGIVFLVVMVSCNEKKEQPTNNISFKPESSKAILASRFIEEVDVIPLTFEGKTIPIGFIKKIEITDHNIIIWDGFNMSILIFDHKGVFISEIRRIGNGPQEYVKIHDIVVCDNDKAIVIYDQNKYSLLKYKIPSGEFIEKIPFHFLVDELVFYNNYYYGYSPNENNFSGKNTSRTEYGILKFDKKGNYIENTLKIGGDDQKFFSPVGVQSICVNGDIFSLFPVFKDSIYTMNSQDHNFTKIGVDFGNQTLPNELRFGDFSHSSSAYQKVMTSNFVSNKLYFLQSPSLIHFVGVYSNKTFFAAYSTKTKSSFQYLGLLDNIEDLFIPVPISVHNDYFYGIIVPAYLEDYIKSIKETGKELHVDIEQNIRKLSDLLSDPYKNPIIVKFKPIN